MRNIVCLTALVLCACATSGGTVKSPRPVEEDPWRYVPAGAEVVFELDVDQLRNWADGEKIVGVLARMLQDRGIPGSIWSQLEHCYGTLTDVASARTRSLVLAHLHPNAVGIRDLLGTTQTPVEVTYEGVSIWQGANSSVAMILPNWIVWGEGNEVRRAIDLVQGREKSIADSHDPAWAIWRNVPRAYTGEPPVRLAMVPREAWLRYCQGNRARCDFKWLTAAIAVADGFDIGAIAEYATSEDSHSLVRQLQTQIRTIAQSPMAGFLGIRSLLDPLIFVAKEREIHLAYRIAGERFRLFSERVESMVNFFQHSKANPQ